MKALDQAKAQGEGVEEGVKLAFRMALVAPSFLYRAEIDPAGTTGLHPVSPYELATRLSYFLWSSTPDDQLLDAAGAAGSRNLARREIFAAQVARMLDDSKAGALLDDFAAQWLGTRALAYVSPKTTAPGLNGWGDGLRQAMMQETRLFIGEFLKTGRNVTDLLDTDFTFVNDRLASFYGLATPGAGNELRRVQAANHRFGLLSQAGILTVTSNPDRTSIPKRGKWILSHLLCSPPGAPPPNVPALPDDPKKQGLPANATIRDRLERHISDSHCSGCHQTVDPPGYALEHYNAIGRWRDSYPGGASIDVRGKIGDQGFDGAQDLSKLLKSDPRFVTCFTRAMFSYALGRDPEESGDESAVGSLGADSTAAGGSIRNLIALIASSDAFQLRGGQR